MDQTQLFFRFGIATAIGFLIGVQHEFAHGGKGGDIFAGERTLALMGLLGCAAAFLTDIVNTPWAFLVSVLLLGIFIAAGYLICARRGGDGAYD
jgi:hypothetical protein